MRISEEKQGIQKNVQMMKTKLASNAEWYTLCDFAPQNCLLVGGPQSPGTAPYRSWLRVSTKRFDAGIRPAENCIMEMCITGHSTDGKHHSQSMEKFLTFPHPANSVSHSFIYRPVIQHSHNVYYCGESPHPFLLSENLLRSVPPLFSAFLPALSLFHHNPSIGQHWPWPFADPASRA